MNSAFFVFDHHENPWHILVGAYKLENLSDVRSIAFVYDCILDFFRLSLQAFREFKDSEFLFYSFPYGPCIIIRRIGCKIPFHITVQALRHQRRGMFVLLVVNPPPGDCSGVLLVEFRKSQNFLVNFAETCPCGDLSVAPQFLFPLPRSHEVCKYFVAVLP